MVSKRVVSVFVCFRFFRPFSDFRIIFGCFGGREAVEIAAGGRALHPASVLGHGDFSGPDFGTCS